MFLLLCDMAKQDTDELTYKVHPVLVNLEIIKIRWIEPLTDITIYSLKETFESSLITAFKQQMKTFIKTASDSYYFSKLTFSEIVQKLDNNKLLIGEDVPRTELLDLSE